MLKRIPACTVPHCPAPRDPDWHKPWCDHGLAGHHHHVPKRSQGGKRIVAFLCPVCHMEVDNGISLGNSVWKDKDGREHYLLWDVAKGINEPLIDRVLEAGSAAAEGGDAVPGKSPLVVTPAESGRDLSGRGERATNRTPSAGISANAPSVLVPGGESGPSAAAPPASGGKGEANPSGRQEPLGSAEVVRPFEARSEGRAVAQPHPESSVAEPLDEGALPTPARDSRLVPSPSATPPSFDLNSWCEDLMKLVYLGLALRGAKEAWQLSVGDQYNQGERFLGNKVFGYMRPFKDGAVRQYTWVAGCVSVDTRVPELSYTYYRAVAKLPPGAQKKWLAQALKENLDTKEFHRLVHGEKPRVKRWTLKELRELAKEWWALVKARPADDKTKMVWFLDWLEATCAIPAGKS